MDKFVTTLVLTISALTLVVSLLSVPGAIEAGKSSETVGRISMTEVTPLSDNVSVEKRFTDMVEPEWVIEDIEDILFQEENAVGVLKSSNLTAEELETGLLFDLKEYSEAFIEAEKTTGVNAVFLASIAALESGWASSDVALTNNNLFGWESNSGGYCYFESKEKCILYVADALKRTYLEPDGIYFCGYEVSDVNKNYNGRQHWEDTVVEIMEEITERIEKGKYNEQSFGVD